MQSKEDVTTNLVERLDWRCARRDENRVARRWWKKQAVDAIYSLEEGAILDEFVHFLDEVGALPAGRPCRGPGSSGRGSTFSSTPAVWDENLFGIEAMNALLACCSVMKLRCGWPGSMRCRCATVYASGVTRSDRATSRWGRSVWTPWLITS